MPRPWKAEGKSWSSFQSQRLLLLRRSEPSLSPRYFTLLMILRFLLQQVKSLYQTLQQLKQDWLTAFQDFGFMGELRDCIPDVLSFILSYWEYQKAESIWAAFFMDTNKSGKICAQVICSNLQRNLLCYRRSLDLQHISLKAVFGDENNYFCIQWSGTAPPPCRLKERKKSEIVNKVRKINCLATDPTLFQ